MLQTLKDLVGPVSRKHLFRTSFDSQHVKVSETLVKPVSEHFYHIFSSFWGEMIWKVSPLVKSKISGVFVNTLAADQKYPVLVCENMPLPIQTIFS